MYRWRTWPCLAMWSHLFGHSCLDILRLVPWSPDMMRISVCTYSWTCLDVSMHACLDIYHLFCWWLNKHFSYLQHVHAYPSSVIINIPFQLKKLRWKKYPPKNVWKWQPGCMGCDIPPQQKAIHSSVLLIHYQGYGGTGCHLSSKSLDNSLWKFMHATSTLEKGHIFVHS